MRRILTAGLCALALSLVAACGGASDMNTNAGSANANSTNAMSAAGAPSSSAADASEINRSESNGVVTETRSFRSGPVEKVVVTTRDGKRTARVYSRETGEIRDLPEGKIDMALSATGDALNSAAGFASEVGREAADKLEDAAGKTKSAAVEVGDKAEDAGDKAKSGAREVGDKAEDVGDKAKSGGRKVVSGAKKAGGAIKKAVTP
jgi:hypothetical protein